MKKKQRHVWLQGTILLGVLAGMMMLLPALSVDDRAFNGFEIAFGKELVDFDFFGLGSVASAKLIFNVWALLAYTLPIVGALILLIRPNLALLSVLSFVASIVLMAMLPNQVYIQTTLLGSQNLSNVDWSLAYGIFLAMAFNGLAAVGALRYSMT